MYCINCGAKNPDGARFCMNCGSPMNSSSASHVNPPLPPQQTIPAKPSAATAKAPAWARITKIWVIFLFVLTALAVSYGIFAGATRHSYITGTTFNESNDSYSSSAKCYDGIGLLSSGGHSWDVSNEYEAQQRALAGAEDDFNDNVMVPLFAGAGGALFLAVTGLTVITIAGKKRR